MQGDSSVEKVPRDPLPHGVPVGEVVGALAHLGEATEGPVVQIGQDVVQDVIWQLREQHGGPPVAARAPQSAGSAFCTKSTLFHLPERSTFTGEQEGRQRGPGTALPTSWRDDATLRQRCVFIYLFLKFVFVLYPFFFQN